MELAEVRSVILTRASDIQTLSSSIAQLVSSLFWLLADGISSSLKALVSVEQKFFQEDILQNSVSQN